MAKKKTAEELAEDIKTLEDRLAKAKEQQRKLTKAEEATQNASVIKAVRECWDALPADQRPEWKQLPGYIRKMFQQLSSGKAAPGQSE